MLIHVGMSIGPNVRAAVKRPAGAVSTAPGQAKAVSVVKATATVEAVDAATRTVTLKMPKGDIRSLVASEEVEFIDDRDTIRQQIVQILTAMLRDEEKVELEVRKRITSQKKEILEGSEEWDVLHKKYYQDELRRLGIAASPDDRRRS